MDEPHGDVPRGEQETIGLQHLGFFYKQRTKKGVTQGLGSKDGLFFWGTEENGGKRVLYCLRRKIHIFIEKEGNKKTKRREKRKTKVKKTRERERDEVQFEKY